MIPLQFALEIVHSIFVILEVIFGYIALRTLARFQISRFHYKQFDMPDNNEQLGGNEFNWMPKSTDLKKVSWD